MQRNSMGVDTNVYTHLYQKMNDQRNSLDYVTDFITADNVEPDEFILNVGN